MIRESHISLFCIKTLSNLLTTCENFDCIQLNFPVGFTINSFKRLEGIELSLSFKMLLSSSQHVDN